MGAHLNGKVVDVNNALEGDGPFSPERSGGLPLLDFLRYVSEKDLDLHQVQHEITRNSGFVAYLGTKDCREIEKRIRNGDSRARLIYRAFVYQVAKEIGALAAAVFDGRLDAVALSGGIAAGSYFKRWMKKLRITLNITGILMVVIQPLEMTEPVSTRHFYYAKILNYQTIWLMHFTSCPIIYPSSLSWLPTR